MAHMQETADLRLILSHPLTPVPYSIGTADGFLATTDKPNGYQLLVDELDDVPMPPPDSTLVIEDGNARVYCMQPEPSTF